MAQYRYSYSNYIEKVNVLEKLDLYKITDRARHDIYHGTLFVCIGQVIVVQCWSIIIKLCM